MIKKGERFPVKKRTKNEKTSRNLKTGGTKKLDQKSQKGSVRNSSKMVRNQQNPDQKFGMENFSKNHTEF